MNDISFKVLIADDEYWIRENLRGLLDWPEHSFLFLEPVEDGEQALEAIRSQCPDIVITDVNMPFLSGTELIEKVRAEFPETVFVALSGYSDYDYVRSALLAGAVDYLLKPISKGDLLEVLDKAVSRIIAGRKRKLEQKETQEKLRIASMSAADRELSQLIHRTNDQKQNTLVQSRLTEYELDFSGFTLVVFRTAGLARILRTSKEKEPDELVCKIKDLILAQVRTSKNLVFNYIYRNNEFLLITGMDTSRLDMACEKIILMLKELTGFPATALIGRHYFSFSNLREAYNDALLALLAEKFSGGGGVVRVSDTADCTASKRMSMEQEKQLQLAVSTGNRMLFQKVLFEEIRLRDCVKNAWRFVEVRQTADSVAWILRGSLSPNAKASQLLALDNLAELLQLAVDSFDAEEMNAILEQMLDEVFEPESQPKQSENMRQTVAQVKEYIDGNYFEDLSLTMLSNRFLAESSYLSKAFKAAAGDNLMLYIAKKRVERAKEYLKQDRLSITEISRLVGYGDYAYFSRVFRKVTGVSPREYKEGAVGGL